MKYLEITGGVPLHGTIRVQGSKNAVLPILVAGMLGEGGCVIENCPDIGDVRDLLSIMKKLGCVVRQEERKVYVNGDWMTGYQIVQSQEASRIRCSILFLGALLGKMGRAILPMPGGCAIGARPIDLHLLAMERLGAEFVLDGKIEARVRQLRGARIQLRIPSVGATENVILASVMAEGETILENAAREPEIDELCEFLNLRGADILRQRDGNIRIRGVRSLKPVVYRMKADRIVTGTYLLAAAATGGSIQIQNFPKEELNALLLVLKKMGAVYRRDAEVFQLDPGGVYRSIPYLETAPYPGFPTDLQSPLLAVLCRIPGKSCICERIFEQRFATADGLRSMGASISTKGRCAYITGVPKLYGADLDAPDLRGGAALVVAALQCSGRTRISQVEYIERGYENISRDLSSLGAKIRLRNERETEKLGG